MCQDDHNKEICHQVEHRLQAPHKVKKVILYWLPCGAGGSTVTTNISRMHG